MKMLECIAMLNYLLSQLEAGKRIQVSTSVYNEVKAVLIPLYKKIATFSNEQTQFALESLLEAVNMIDVSSLQYLTDTARDALVEGVTCVKDEVAMQAFEHFKSNEFEPTDDIVPIMRDVVRTAAMKGAI